MEEWRDGGREGRWGREGGRRPGDSRSLTRSAWHHLAALQHEKLQPVLRLVDQLASLVESQRFYRQIVDLQPSGHP